jgi:hypothetical protein
VIEIKKFPNYLSKNIISRVKNRGVAELFYDFLDVELGL